MISRFMIRLAVLWAVFALGFGFLTGAASANEMGWRALLFAALAPLGIAAGAMWLFKTKER